MPREPFLLGNFPKQLNDVFTPADIEQLQSRSSLEDPFFLLKKHKNGIQIAHVKDWMTFFEFVPEEERMVGFLDPSTLPQNPGWPLRNFLLLLKRQFQITKVSVLCLRRTLTEALQIDSSIILNVVLPGGWEGWLFLLSVNVVAKLNRGTVGVMPKSVGWEKTFAGKLAPRMADLGSVMDPQRCLFYPVAYSLPLI